MSSPLARSTSTMSSADMEALFAKIHKEQAAQLELLRHTKRAMDKSITARDGSDGAAVTSLAGLSFEILGELLDEIVLDVVLEAHREVKAMKSTCPICKTKCRNYVVRPGVDIFGQNPSNNNSQTYDCVHCNRSFPAQRYAPHLEKCLGLSGRASSRAASRRMGAERAGSGSPFTPVSYSDDREASDSDKDLLEKKRKKPAASAANSGSHSSNPNNGGDYGTPSSAKSSSSSTSKVKKSKASEPASDLLSKTQKPSSSLAKGSKGGSSSSKLKGLGLHAPSASQSGATSSTPSTAAAGVTANVGEITLGYLDDNLLLANGKSLQNGSGGSGGGTQKLSSSNPKKSGGGGSGGGGVNSAKRPPGGSGAGHQSSTGSSSSGKNGQVLSFYDSLRAIGGGEESSGPEDLDGDTVMKGQKETKVTRSDRRFYEEDEDYMNEEDDDYEDDKEDDKEDEDYRDDVKVNGKANKARPHHRPRSFRPTSAVGGGGHDPYHHQHASSHRHNKKSAASGTAAHSGHASDSLDTDFIDIDGDGDDDAMEILQTPKKKRP